MAVKKEQIIAVRACRSKARSCTACPRGRTKAVADDFEDRTKYYAELNLVMAHRRLLSICTGCSMKRSALP